MNVAEKVDVIDMGKEQTNNIQADFWSRHIGPNKADLQHMLTTLGYESLEAFIDQVVPDQITFKQEFSVRNFEEPQTEAATIARIKKHADNNTVVKSYIGQGYYDCIVPPVIQRNILENPGWYTQYTPYQPEISQGRLEALFNYQTMVADLTGLPVANSSLLDEGTAAAEAMSMAYHIVNKKNKVTKNIFLVSELCHAQSIAVIKTRAEALGIELRLFAGNDTEISEDVFGLLLQYPATDGSVNCYESLVQQAKDKGIFVTVASDLLALALLKPPGEWGADAVVGNSQRFGVPYGYGGPHAAFFATKEEYRRLIPGRVVGLSIDRQGNPALRLALQTREQHIRREKATSNICTAQVLLAIMAGMYAVYHGPENIKKIASQVNGLCMKLKISLEDAGLKVLNQTAFDTLTVEVEDLASIKQRAEAQNICFAYEQNNTLRVAVDETTTAADLATIVSIINGVVVTEDSFSNATECTLAKSGLLRESKFMTHPVFNSYHSETEFLRYVRRLEAKDLSLGTAMIPLGSCTMKLNATSEMLPVTWPEFGGIHPFVPEKFTKGYQDLCKELEEALADITGLAAVSLQPNAGSQGEYAGLLAIRAYHRAQGNTDRNICLIPKSAHGTNPASAVMAGFKVVVIDCDKDGNIDLADLKEKILKHQDQLGALMVTYPSTHGVFEETIKEISELIHKAGGQVYLDGANLNALVGLVKVGELGADVMHINLHKTFCIPHGGGGPGMGPIAVAEHLRSYLPGNPLQESEVGPVSAANYGSASILPISWVYMALMGAKGLKYATEVAIVSANYIAKRLENAYPVVYKGASGLVAHECILDVRSFKQTAGIEVEDIAKRLMDYGFHAPTISWPVAGTMMIEPTESESLAEIDRFCEALLQIREEIKAIEEGKAEKANNVLSHAPHTAALVTNDEWDRPYTRKQAAYPSKYQAEYKFWPAVARIDSAYGDKNFICTCPDISEY